MKQMKNNFLESVSFISENQAEYSILTDLYNTCRDKTFLLELDNLNEIKEYYNDVVKFINTNYKSFELKKFHLLENGSIEEVVLRKISASSLKDTEIINEAIEQSKNSSYVLLRSNSTLALFYNGFFDARFENVFADKQKMLEEEREKRDIEQLEWAFDDFHLNRKYKGCDYVVAGKVSDNVSEQELRNDLMEFLKKKTKLYIVPELCTSKTEDEESVDIGVIDSDNRVAIIEVKYFVKKGLFQNVKKHAYGVGRFLDGFEQLDRYCIHLNQDSYNLHSAFLYMFYADTRTKDQVKEVANSYLEKYLVSENSVCSIKFRNHFKSTYCDDMLDI